MKKILGILLCTALLFGCTANTSSKSMIFNTASSESDMQATDTDVTDAEDDSITVDKRWKDWEYCVVGDEIAVSRCFAKTETVVLPQEIEGKPVTKVLYSEYNSMRGVRFCKSRKVAHVVIPDSIVCVEMEAFHHDLIKTITIGKNVQKIEFEYGGASVPSYLKSIIVDPENEMYTSQDGVLYDKAMHQLLVYPSEKKETVFKAPDSLEKICDMAFTGAIALERVELNDSLQEMEHGVFMGCENLKEIKIGDSIRRIASSSFERTPFWDEYVNAYESKVVYYKDILMGVRGTYKEQQGEFDQYPEEPLEVKKGTRVIADNALYGELYAPSTANPCELILPDGLESIGEHAFELCNKINKMTIPKSVKYIGDTAFAETDIEFTVYKDSYAHKYLKKNGFKKIVVKE